MANRRKGRFKTLFMADAERVIRDALKLRKTIIEINGRLDVTGRPYLALHAVTDAIHEALPVVAGREPDFRAADLGLLPLPGRDGE